MCSDSGRESFLEQMKNPNLPSLKLAYFIVLTLDVCWGYTSYKYNWLNVGGGTGDVNFWIIAGEIATYAFFASWLGLFVLTGINSRNTFSTWWSRGISWLLAIALPINTAFAADWFFHRGFPTAPPM
jgi:hypothetical protein